MKPVDGPVDALLGLLGAVNWLFIRRVEVIHKAPTAFEHGEFSARVTGPGTQRMS
jgi:hypothetical protein